MEYNTTRPKLLLPEYGRNVQEMIAHAMEIADREERNKATRAIIEVMGQLNPHLRDVDDFRHKLWTHLFVMSDFKLDVDSPYEIPKAETLQSKPDAMQYPKSKIKYGHYGKYTQEILASSREVTDESERDYLKITMANFMKKQFLAYNNDTVENHVIADQLKDLSKGDLILENPDELMNTNLILKSFGIQPNKRNNAKKNNKNNKNKNRKRTKKMPSFEIHGGKKLKGELTVQGAKNEALQVLCAPLLTAEKVTISNIPDIVDVNKLIDLLQTMGVKIEKVERGTYVFQAKDIDLAYLESEDFKKRASSLRGSIMIVGPLLARFGKGFIPKPGGDKIGRRRLDTHFEGFALLGAKFNYDAGEHFYSIEAKKLKGTYIHLDEASVTGTANVVMAAVLAEGTTTFYNAACEPYVQQLCKMLNAMGAKISGIGSNLLTIEGVKELKGCYHRILPDMIEVGSFIGLAAMTQSEITIKDVSWENLGVIPNTFKRLGIKLERRGDDIFVPEQDLYEIDTFIDGSILTIYDAPWPGFTPDLLSIILVVATQAKGSVLIHQKMFESRLFFTDKLIDMGAQIILCDPHRATVIGLGREHQLRGINMTSPDIRAGVSLLIAALSAKGKSVIHNIEQIDRGYQDIDIRLRNIGADIRRIN